MSSESGSQVPLVPIPLVTLQTPQGTLYSGDFEACTHKSKAGCYVCTADCRTSRLSRSLVLVRENTEGKDSLIVEPQVPDVLSLTGESEWQEYSEICRQAGELRSALKRFQPSEGFENWKEKSLKDRSYDVALHLARSARPDSLKDYLLAVGDEQHGSENTHILCDTRCPRKHDFSTEDIKRLDGSTEQSIYMEWLKGSEGKPGRIGLTAGSPSGFKKTPYEPGSLEALQQDALDRFGTVIISHVLREASKKTQRSTQREGYLRLCEVAQQNKDSHVFARNRRLVTFPFPITEDLAPVLPSHGALNQSGDRGATDPRTEHNLAGLVVSDENCGDLECF